MAAVYDLSAELIGGGNESQTHRFDGEQWIFPSYDALCQSMYYSPAN